MLKRLAVLLAVALLVVPSVGSQVNQTTFPSNTHPSFSMPMGQMHYFDLTGFTVTVGSQSNGTTNFVAAVPGSGTDCNPTEADGEAASRNFDCGGVQGRLRYTGSGPLMCHVAATFSFRAATGNDIFVIAVLKNGVLLQDSRVLATLASNVDHGASIHAFPTMTNGDYIEIAIANTTAGRNATTKSLQLFAMCMP